MTTGLVEPARSLGRRIRGCQARDVTRRNKRRGLPRQPLPRYRRRMKRSFPAVAGVLLLAASVLRAEAPRPELLLVGGGLRVCGSMASEACTEAHFPDSARQAPASYRLDREGIAAATDPALWGEAPAALRELVRRLLDAAQLKFGAKPLREASLRDWLGTRCVEPDRVDRWRRCRSGEIAPWSKLLDDEQFAVLAALEQPDLDAVGKRRREWVRLQATVDPAGPEILRAFVAAARLRSGDARPRIAVVTAASIDPFAAVDFYLAAFDAAGAEAQWWPLDAATALLGADDRDCGALEDARRRALRLPNRARAYPDLAAAQASACRAGLDALPAQVHGVFFGGGDQWRLRRALFDGDAPRPALVALRAAFARGELVVGGTSAGMAVQSDRPMPTSGDAASAWAAAPVAAPPPEYGCRRAGRCAGGVDESALTFWPAGGFGLVEGAVFDTHFSERGRPARLARFLAAGNATIAFGADENTALHLVADAGAWRVDVLGAGGVWALEPHAGSTAQWRASYVRPGAKLRWLEAGLQPAVEAECPHWPAPERAARTRRRADPAAADQARAAMTLLAQSASEVVVSAAGRTLRLSRTAASRRCGDTAAASSLLGIDFRIE